MPWPPAYNPVYHLHLRLPEPSLHANPLLQTPPVPHLEGGHLIQWLASDPKQLSSTVLGDSLRFALKDHDSGKLIPHLPVPLMAGPFLLDTLLGSKYQVLFHQPHVLLEGKPVGVFQWVIAPPWRCIEVKLPLPRFLARAGRAGAARGAAKRLAAAQKAKGALAAAEKAWEDADSLREGMAAVRKLEAAPQQQAAAPKQASDALKQEEQRQAWLAAEERQLSARQAERAALERKRECDRLSRKSGRLTKGAQAWAQEAREQEAAARERRAAARAERASQRRAEEAQARASGKKVNPTQQASGESNAGLTAPSLLAHLPFPATVEIQVSWSQIGKTWVNGLVGAAAEALKYYVGFVFDGVIAPGQSKGVVFLLDLVKSVINDTLIDGGAKYLTQGKWPFKVSKKLGPVKLGLQLEPDPATGTRKWKVTIEHKSKAPVLGAANTKGSLEGHGHTLDRATVESAGQSAEHTFTPPVDYAHGVFAVN